MSLASSASSGAGEGPERRLPPASRKKKGGKNCKPCNFYCISIWLGGGIKEAAAGRVILVTKARTQPALCLVLGPLVISTPLFPSL